MSDLEIVFVHRDSVAQTVKKVGDVILEIYNVRKGKDRFHNSRVNTEVRLEVAYTCNVLTVSDSQTSPDIGTS